MSLPPALRGLGLSNSLGRVLRTEFDYRTQALLHVPSRVSDVRAAAFPPKATEEITKLIEIAGGPLGDQAREGLHQLKDLGLSVNSKIKAPKVKH